jgi:hypothetical protein
MEAGLRKALKPEGPIGNLLFGRFWSCVLRLILVARLEETGLAPRRNAAKKHMATASLREGFMPVLVTEEDPENSSAMSADIEALEPDLFHRLALIARYDRAASREMYRTLFLLTLLRDNGDEGLLGGIRVAAGIKTVDGEEK